MCDVVAEYELANIKLNLINLSDMEKAFCDELLLPFSPQKKVKDQYFYEFHRQLHQIRRDRPVFELLNARYYIHNDVCFVDFKNGGRAIWDFSSKVFKYHDGTRYRNLRNWFFLNIIDPFSLACVEKGRLVVHGSLWENNGVGSIICGESGSGKSTLSFLAKEEVIVHCDDCLVLSYENDAIVAQPINSGFGIKKNIIQNYNIGVDKKNILVENKEKIYLRHLGESVPQHSHIPLKNIFILKSRTACTYTQVTKIQDSAAVKLFLNLQANLPTKTFKEKFVLIKTILKLCNVFLVEYDDICDIGILLKEIKER